jgi:hypothetical protein
LLTFTALSLFLKDSGRLSALRLFDRLFHCSTARTVKEFFLTSVLANCTASPSTPAAILVLAPPFPADRVPILVRECLTVLTLQLHQYDSRYEFSKFVSSLRII